MAYRKTPAEIRRLEAAREHLVARATEVVAEVGWAHATVTAVADAAGSVYQHFPSKAALAVGVFRHAAGGEVDILGDVLRGPGTPVERLAIPPVPLRDVPRTSRAASVAWTRRPRPW